MRILSKWVNWFGVQLWVTYEHQEEQIGDFSCPSFPEDCTIQEIETNQNIYDVIERSFNLGVEAGIKKSKNELYRPNAFKELEEIILKK